MFYMKRLLICLVAFSVTACKKDKVETTTLTKLKSATTKTTVLSQKIAFTYDENGHLADAKKYVNDVLQSYFEYRYDGSVLTSAKSYIKHPSDNEYDLVANILLSYTGKNLSELAVFPLKPGAPSTPTKYRFEYGSGDVPVKFSIVLNNGRVINAGYGEILSFPFQPGSEYSDRWTEPYQLGTVVSPAIQVSYEYEFDGKKNPFYKLPWIDVAVQDGEISFIFNAPAFFSLHNTIKKSILFGGTSIYSFMSTFTYLSTDYPDKATIITQAPASFKSEVSYEY